MKFEIELIAERYARRASLVTDGLLEYAYPRRLARRLRTAASIDYLICTPCGQAIEPTARSGNWLWQW